MRLAGLLAQLVLIGVLGLLVGARSAPGPIVVFAAEHERVELTQSASGDITLRWFRGDTPHPELRGDTPHPGSMGTRRMQHEKGAALRVTVVGGGTLEVGSLSVIGALELSAHRITMAGEVSATRLVLTAEDLLDVEATAVLHAWHAELVGRVVMNVGTVSADGSEGGAITLAGERVMNQGALSARGAGGKGGTVHIAFGSHYLESRRGSIDVSGGQDGGEIELSGSEGSHLFSSGSHGARGRRGGAIALGAGDVRLVGARLDASGIEGGGTIDVGGHIDLGEPAPPGRGALATRHIAAVGGSELLADGQESGPGGRIVLASLEATVFGGHASARGGPRAGDGGFVDVSSAGEVGVSGKIETDAPRGRAGRVLLDPKNITISDQAGLLHVDLEDPSPFAGDLFGESVVSLASGNIVVRDRLDDFAASNAGAVHLFSGQGGALLATLTGTSADDQVGSDGVTALTNGNYVVRSTSWNNGGVVDAGAVTWGNGATGIAGAVSAANSLVGSTASDVVGNGGATALTNGNYVVRSNNWNNGGVVGAGAVTWGNGATGIAGAVSAANSLVGSTASDVVGNGGVTALTNGNYVVRSNNWNNGGVVGAGAVTWGNGATGIAGAVSAANSLVGSTAGDSVGSFGVTALTNGNYVVRSPSWDNGGVVDAGAATWGNGATGIAGAVSAANSLVGSTASDVVGNGGATALTNGNYVLISSFWDNGGVVDAGAVTWGNGATGIAGAVSAANSLVGSTASAFVGNPGVTALTNGNYVVRTASWNNGGVVDAGAVTWGNGATGIAGAVSAANSLVGSTAGDTVGNQGVTALTNGNYVVISTNWDNGAVVGAGAVTWGNGATGIAGAVSAANSLVGSTASDSVGSVTTLTNGNYVVISSNWDNGAVVGAGAVTWGNGATGIAGAVSAANSLVGSVASDQVGNGGATALTNGNYVVRSTLWNNSSVVDAGAVTWGNGATGIAGAVSAANSLVGSVASDAVGNGGATALTNGNYVVRSTLWNNSSVVDAGAVTWGNGATGIAGAVSAANSLVGSVASDQLGSGGVVVLSTGDYVVGSPLWDNGFSTDAGALTPGGGTIGTSGVLSASNSLLGPAAGSGTSSFAVAGAAGTFIGSFPLATPATYVALVFSPDVPLTYAFASARSFTIAPDAVVKILSQGTDLALEASNDLIVEADLVVDNPAGDGGQLSLAAGRRIELNASVTTDGGDLTLIANDVLASGVVDAERDPGTGGIAWDADNAVVDVGAGAFALHVRDGAGKTHATSGALHLGQATAGSVLAQVEGATLVLQGDVTVTGAGDAIVLVSDSFVVADGFFPHSLNAPAGRSLVYAPSPAATSPGLLTFDFEEYDKTFPAMPDPLNTGDGILYAAGPPDASPIVTVEQGAGQADPTSDAAITFDVAFDQDVTGLSETDVDLGLSTAGANLMAKLAGGPASYTLTVSGMDSAGVVIARVPAGVCDAVSGGLQNAASVSVDNVVTWTAGGGAGGDGGGAGAEGPGGSGAEGSTPPDEEGCSCSTPGRRGGGGAALGTFAMGAALVLGLLCRRGRPSRSRPRSRAREGSTRVRT